MVEVNFYEQVEDSLLKFAVILAKTGGKWVFCKHRERDTYEFPGGHREPGETILETAARELQEETGAIDFTLKPVCVYSVKGKTQVNKSEDDESFGMLFAADITSFEKELHSEIEKILTRSCIKTEKQQVFPQTATAKSTLNPLCPIIYIWKKRTILTAW